MVIDSIPAVEDLANFYTRYVNFSPIVKGVVRNGIVNRMARKWNCHRIVLVITHSGFNILDHIIVGISNYHSLVNREHR
jgi:hypothetical protein